MQDAEYRLVRIAILDLYEGHPNQGMRCIHEIIDRWATANQLRTNIDSFEVRLENKLPDLSYDIYISTGGPFWRLPRPYAAGRFRGTGI